MALLTFAARPLSGAAVLGAVVGLGFGLNACSTHRDFGAASGGEAGGGSPSSGGSLSGGGSARGAGVSSGGRSPKR